MRRPIVGVMGVGVVAAVLLWLSFAPTPVQAQAGAQPPTPGSWPRFTVPRISDGRPNLNGIWQALVTANFNVEDHEAQALPLQVIARR